MNPQCYSPFPGFHMPISPSMDSFFCRCRNPVCLPPHFFLDSVGSPYTQLMFLQADDVWGALQIFQKQPSTDPASPGR